MEQVYYSDGKQEWTDSNFQK